MAVRRRRASWSVVAEVWTMTWQPGIIFGGYLVGRQHTWNSHTGRKSVKTK